MTSNSSNTKNLSNIAGRRVRQAREACNMDQCDLAATLSVEYGIHLSQSDISEIERQKRGIRDYELDAISKALNVTLDWLLRGI